MRYAPKSTYVPTTDEVETGFHEFASWLETKHPGEYEQAPEFADWREAMHGFRRWLNQVKAEVWDHAEGAFEEAHKADMLEPWTYMQENPYRKAEK